MRLQKHLLNKLSKLDELTTEGMYMCQDKPTFSFVITSHELSESLIRKSYKTRQKDVQREASSLCSFYGLTSFKISYKNLKINQYDKNNKQL